MFGFKVGRRWVSTCGDFARRLTVPGGAAVPTAAVTVVTVHPPYRRRGLLTAMMTHQLEQVAERGEPLAALWASESLIYGRFGYGPATTRAVLKGTNRRLAFLPGRRVDRLGRRGHPGAVPRRCARPARVDAARAARDDGARRRRVGVRHLRPGVRPPRRLRAALRPALRRRRRRRRLRDLPLQGGVREDPEGEVRIKEVWAEDAGAHAGLWRYLLDLDLARTFPLLERRPRRAAAPPRRGRPRGGHELTDNLYLRVVDVEAALAARKYAAGVDLVIEVDDPVLPANSGRYRLVTDGDPEGSDAEVTRVTSTPDLRMGVLELGTIYLGGVPPQHLHRVRRVTEHTPGAVAAASDGLRLAPRTVVPRHVLTPW